MVKFQQPQRWVMHGSRPIWQSSHILTFPPQAKLCVYPLQVFNNFLIDPRENAANTRQFVQGFIAAGATHVVLASRTLDEGIAHWLSEEIIQPLREVAGDTAPVGEPQVR